MATFQKILIANRAEIAVRVMRTCRELGITTVAVYSELDRDAFHVRYADEAYALGGETAAESYLNTDAILDVIRRSGAEAVHPGYGFFAENADFAEAIQSLDGPRGPVTWIGPPPSAIRIMGDKISSRKAALEAKVPMVPGTTEALESAAEVVAFGDEHGWPVAIKAAFGGGGKGMKIARSADEAEKVLESAQREAQAYFGRPEAYLERYLERPRHVEIQVFSDTHGNHVWLGERDCSVQRRHQKLIEESPAPGVDDATRKAMGEAAVHVAAACGYVGAGTVEMLYQPPERPSGQAGDFFFLEMNTRLQVEHCVTEMVTGFDLVREQIRVAAGEPLSFTQEDVQPRGHSIECRINAEDPAKKFLPSPGTITRFDRPAGPGVRIDHGYEAGDTISQFYDNLVAKLIVWGSDRDEAIARARRALGETLIEGIKTTIPAHLTLLAHPDFVAGNHSTKWLEDEVDPGLLATASGSGDSGATSISETPETQDTRAEHTVPVEVDGKRFTVRLWLPDLPAGAAPSGRVKPRMTAGAGAGGAGSGSGTISAPMQGTIVKVLVSPGDAVKAGESVVVLEAMKMENHINAESDGTVKEVRVEPGQTVSGGDV
ncbi:MAG: acetyl-CoA carboxylase biotin carboxylase subunit, partial [Actinobacteria bacterium]|nr:acetyl-CoA carboxylase biotin carboxylase subunit [Actinomycetota bacterium]